MCSYSFSFVPQSILSKQSTMVALSKPTIQQLYVTFPPIPLVDLSKPESKQLLVKACQDFGFCKVVNHGVPMKFINELESEAIKFFSSPLSVKQKAALPHPLGYGNKNIGQNGDVGWVEYLLLNTKPISISEQQPENLQRVVGDYVTAVKTMACEILELMAEELNVEPRNAFSKLLMDEESDSVFRVNHYPGRPEVEDDDTNGESLIGFGEHTDPQIISVLRSNNATGLEISLGDGRWVSVPPDADSFFINVGDSLQVMTNGRFKSIKHRVVANSKESRVSMIYFGGPPLNQKIAPLPSLLETDEDSLYNEFTWFEYKNYTFNSALSQDRLGVFQKIPSKI